MVIDHLKFFQERSEDIGLAYILFDHNDHVLYSKQSFLRILLRQLLEHKTEIVQGLFGDRARTVRSYSYETLRSIIVEVVSTLRATYILLDGIDQVSHDFRPQLAEMIQDLHHLGPLRCVRLFITSRSFRDAGDIDPRKYRYKTESSDIDQFVRWRLYRSRKLQKFPKLRDEICERLLHSRERVWVFFYRRNELAKCI